MDRLDKIEQALDGLTKEATKKALKPAAAFDKRGKEIVNPDAPFVTTGAVGKSGSFSLSKCLGAKLGFIDESAAKDDLHAAELFSKALQKTGQWANDFSTDRHTLKYPLDTRLLGADVQDTKEYKVFKAMEAAGAAKADPDETRWVLKKADMSYLLDSVGGELVAPPQMGQLIELVRPQEAFLRAGATTVPLPPNGRIAYPRQTGATSAYWVGENASITASNPTFGQVILQAKKLGDYVVLANELLKYAGVAVDGIIRADMAKTLALALDNACFYGAGSAMMPKGLVNYTGSNEVIDYATQTPAPKGVAANGNTLRPEDAYRMVGLVEDRNFEFTGWITRPSVANNVLGYRADAAAPADAAGAFVQGLMRAVGDKIPSDQWCGYKVTKSAVVRNNQTKGTGTGLSEIFGGQWEHWLIGMFGAVEIATSREAGNLFQQDQTAIRALMHCDAAPRYEGAFIWYKQILVQTN